MKLLNRQLRRLFDGLNALDGRPETKHITGQNGKEQDVLLSAPYKFDEKGKARYSIGKNLSRIQVEHDGTSKTIDGIRKECTLPVDEDEVEVPMSDVHPNFRKYTDGIENMLADETDELTLYPLIFEHLKVEKNQIPGSILAWLQPVLKYENESECGEEEIDKADEAEPGD